MLVIGVMLLAIGLLAMPFLQDDLFIPWQLVALLLIALANGFIGPSLLSMITQYCEPHEVGRTTGLNQSFGSLGRVIGLLSAVRCMNGSIICRTLLDPLY